MGWVNFGCTNCNAHITDSGLTGYAWSQNFGWIKLDPTQSGVDNNAEGALSAYVWGEQTGWINFSGVTVSSAGVFSGTASVDSGGSINFGCANCNVTTDWRPASTRSGGSGGGGGGSVSGGSPINYNPPPPPAPVVPDTAPPSLVITQIQTSYVAGELVVIAGTGEPNAVVAVLIDNGYTSFSVDPQGNWIINLGSLYIGSHHLSLTPTDSAGNVGTTLYADFVVSSVYVPPVYVPPIISQPEEPKKTFILAPPLEPIFRGLVEGIKSLLPGLFDPLVKVQPPPLVIVPQQPPLALQGKFHYLSERDLEKFVLAPLPSDIALLVQKIPKLGKTFGEIGINRITDIGKLKNANLKLPTLTETVVPQGNLPVSSFTALKGIPLVQLPQTARANIPSDVLFVKTADGLVDYNVALSVNDQGRAEQTIKTVVGQYVQLILKTTSPAKKITGYIVFKSKNYTSPVSRISADSLTASLLFANPNLATAALADNKIAVEGGRAQGKLQQSVGDAAVEQRLVLSQFDYVNIGGNIYTATVQIPVVDAEYEVITVVEYPDQQAQEIKLIIVVDPEGYVYNKNGGQETRIAGSVVSLYWLNPETKVYELWPAKDFQQQNPQVTDQRGTYSFLVPEGYYHIKVDAPGYKSYEGSSFQVTEGSGVHINIELKPKNWWLRLIDWKMALLVLVILLLLYNFYKDRVREKLLSKKYK